MYRAGTGNFGEFSPYTINFRGLCKSGGARAPAAPPSSAPMKICMPHPQISNEISELSVYSSIIYKHYYLHIVCTYA